MIAREDEYLDYMRNNMQVGIKYLKCTLDAFYHQDYILECRLKSKEKIHIKQQFLIQKYPDSEEFLKDISNMPDIVGFRISVDSLEDVKEIAKVLSSNADFYKELNYYEKPKESGFRAIVLQFWSDVSGFRYEIQLMTKEMRMWVNHTHRDYDEEKYGVIKNKNYK